MGAQGLITQRDRVKVVQSVVEGITAATYAITPTNPAFAAHGQNATLEENSNPTVAEKRESGDTDRKETTVTREVNSVTYRGYLMTADETLLASVMNKPNGSGTPDESRTFVESYNDDSGTEIFKQYLGCKPQSYSINPDNAGYLVLEIVYSCKQVIEDGVGPTIGSGSFGTALTGTPLTHNDAGAAPFIYNSITTEIRSFSISGSYNEAVQDSLGSIRDMYRKPTQRVISGSADIFKKDATLQTDAKAQTPRTASYVLDSGQITLTFTRFIFKPSNETLEGDSSDASMENKNWESDAVVVA